MYGKRYGGDPRWLTARFGNCAKCGVSVKGKRAFYFPSGRQVFCEEHGESESASFEAAAFDESVMTGEW